MTSVFSPRIIARVVGCSALLAAATSCSSFKTGAVIQPEADQALKSMSATIGSAQTFSFEATRASDAELQRTADFASEAKVAVYVRRPNMVRVKSTSPDGNRDLYYNGKSVTMVDHAAKTFRVDRAPGTINKFVDSYTKGWAAYPPLADLIVSAPYSQIVQVNGKISLLKDETINGELCTHVFCDGDVEDWDVWISKSDNLPRRFDVVYGGLVGSPMTKGDLKNWKLAVGIDDAMFSPEIPAGYKPATD